MGSSTFQKHLIVYIDILGFSNSVQDNEKKYELLNLVHSWKSHEKQYNKCDIKIKKTPIGEEITIPYVSSAFSDHIVISYPLEILAASNVDLTIAFEFLCRAASSIIITALQAGLLTRGAITMGELHHEEGTILGKGLLEAHYLESEIAIYPRILISEKILSIFPPNRTHAHISKDLDGMYYLDNLNTAIMSHFQPGNDYASNIENCIADIKKIIKDNIQRFSNDESKIKALAKWKWFERYFERTLEKPFGLKTFLKI